MKSLQVRAVAQCLAAKNDKQIEIYYYVILCYCVYICYTLKVYDVNMSRLNIIKGSLDEKLPSYEVLKMLRE